MMAARSRCQCCGDVWPPWMRAWRTRSPLRFLRFASGIGLGTFPLNQLYSSGSPFLLLPAILRSIKGVATSRFPPCHKFA
jgi:hypothetical protein